MPVTAPTGQFLGVLGAHVHWDWAREVQLSVISETARRERIGVTVYSQAGDVLLDSGASGWTQPPEPPTITDPRRFRGSMIEAATGGTTYVTGFARSRGYREYRGLGWLIVVRQPASFAFAPVHEFQRRIAGWGFVFAGTLALISWVSAARMARRLRAIGLAADRIRDGDILTVMPPPRGEGEFARMCGALGQMVEAFRTKRESGETTPAPRDESNLRR